MGKLHSKGLPVYGERERTELFVEPQEKERKIQGRPLSIPWLDLDHWIASTERTCINHPNRRNCIGKFFLFPFFIFGYEMLLLIDFFFLLGRFRFDSFLFWVLGLRWSFFGQYPSPNRNKDPGSLLFGGLGLVHRS